MNKLKTYLFIVGLILLNSVHHDAQSSLTSLDIDVIVDGVELKNPLAGGINAAQLSEVDLNDDGIKDLYIFDRAGDVQLTFINEGTANEVSYKFAPEYAKNFPPLNDWVLLRDYNFDGIMDIFAYSSIPGVDGIEVYTGRMDNGTLVFDLFIFEGQFYNILYFPLSNGTETNLFVSSIDYPAVDDIDCDGDLDILTFGPGGGHVDFFANQSIELGYGTDSLIFELEDNCWGGFYESGITEEIDLSDQMGQCFDNLIGGDATTDLRHAGSTILTFDADDDCDKEIVLGDVSFDFAVFLENGGTTETAWMVDQDVHFPTYDVSVDITLFPAHFYLDMDNDGLKDFVAAPNNKGGALDTENIWFYKNITSNEAPRFELQRMDAIVGDMVDVGTGAHPTFVDYDADGLLDLVIGNNTLFKEGIEKDPRLFLYKNIGTAEAPKFELVDDNYLNFSQFGSTTFNVFPEFGDLDNDGDLDLLVGDDYGKLFYAENTAGEGNPVAFGDLQYEWKALDVGRAATPQIIDLNLDGLPDIVMGERGANNDADGVCGNLNYFQNVGTATSPDFIEDVHTAPNTGCLGRVFTIPQFSITGYTVPRFVEIDGHWELFVGIQQGRIIRYSNIENNIYGEFTKVEENYGEFQTGERLFQNFQDINNDGKYDLVLGNQRGGISIYDTGIEVSNVLNTTITDSDFDIKIFPNPASETFNILLEHPVPQDLNVRVFNAIGALVTEQQAQGHTLHLNVANWSSGIYFIEILAGKEITTRKVVVE